MLLNSCQLYNRGRFSSREPGPDLVPPSPRCPTKLGPTLPTINYVPQWAANRHRKFFRLGVALRLHVRTLAATLPMRPWLGLAQGSSPNLPCAGPSLLIAISEP